MWSFFNGQTEQSCSCSLVNFPSIKSPDKHFLYPRATGVYSGPFADTIMVMEAAMARSCKAKKSTLLVKWSNRKHSPLYYDSQYFLDVHAQQPCWVQYHQGTYYIFTKCIDLTALLPLCSLGFPIFQTYSTFQSQLNFPLHLSNQQS